MLRLEVAQEANWCRRSGLTGRVSTGEGHWTRARLAGVAVRPAGRATASGGSTRHGHARASVQASACGGAPELNGHGDAVAGARAVARMRRVLTTGAEGTVRVRAAAGEQ